jgi:hypothetical protein
MNTTYAVTTPRMHASSTPSAVSGIRKRDETSHSTKGCEGATRKAGAKKPFLTSLLWALSALPA